MTALRKQAHELIDALSEQQLVDIINVLSTAKNKNEVEERLDIARSLHGIIPPDITMEEAREERLGKI